MPSQIVRDLVMSDKKVTVITGIGAGFGLVDKLAEAQAEPIQLEYGEITAQDDRVSIVARGRTPLKIGGSYDNIYKWLFTFRDGKICNVKEFFDTLVVLKAFPNSTSPA
jgi:ketosteroid isomerase-like protein